MDTSQNFENAISPPCFLTEAEKSVRQRFVKEYIKDYNAVKACIRIGYSHLFASDFSVKFMNEPYTLNLISEHEGGGVSEAEIDPEKEKKKVLAALWREANNTSFGSSQAARVAALAKLTAIFGMDAPSRSHVTNEAGGGVFVVPGIMNEQQWAEAASKQQEELVKPKSPPDLKAVS